MQEVCRFSPSTARSAPPESAAACATPRRDTAWRLRWHVRERYMPPATLSLRKLLSVISHQMAARDSFLVRNVRRPEVWLQLPPHMRVAHRWLPVGIACSVRSEGRSFSFLPV